MKRADLEAIEARANAATPGTLVVVPDRLESGTLCGYNVEIADSDPRTVTACYMSREDAELYSTAREDIPELIAYCRELEAKLEKEKTAYCGAIKLGYLCARPNPSESDLQLLSDLYHRVLESEENK